jgi:hypothetical protein
MVDFGQACICLVLITIQNVVPETTETSIVVRKSIKNKVDLHHYRHGSFDLALETIN